MGFGSKAPSKTTQINEVKLSPEQKELFELTFPFAQQYANSDVQVYGGSSIAGFNPLELMGQGMAVAGGFQGQDLGNTANATNKFLLNPELLDPNSNPYLKASGDAIASHMTRQLTEGILPSIRNGATATGGMYSGGSTREGIAQGLAVDRTTSNIGDALTKLYSDAYTGGLGTMTDALKLAPLTQSGSLFGSQVLSSVGGQQRAMQQARLDEEIGRFYANQSLPLMRAQELLGLLGGLPGGSGVSTVTGAQPQSNSLMSGLGGAAAGAGLGAALFPTMAAAGPVGAGLGLLAALMMN